MNNKLVINFAAMVTASCKKPVLGDSDSSRACPVI